MAKDKSYAAQFRVDNSKKFKIADHDPRDDAGFTDKEKTKAETLEHAAAIDKLQDRMFAEGKQALLVVLQGMDCSGKDGTIRAVFNLCAPMGVVVTSFKAPTEEELAHDYLWRVHKVSPSKGTVGIFNRSHYEDVLIVKVEKFAPADVIEKRYEQINIFERLLSQSSTRILKFFLNISKKEQAERLQERLDNPNKHWKFKESDLIARQKWDEYMAAYETAIQRCSTDEAPWYAIPADRNWIRNAIIARIVRETLEDMDPKYPRPVGWDPKLVKIS